MLPCMAKKRNAADWAKWVRGRSVMKKNRNAAIACELTAVAAEHDVSLPRAERVHAKDCLAFDAPFRIAAGAVPSFASPASSAKELEWEALNLKRTSPFRLKVGKKDLHGLALSGFDIPAGLPVLIGTPDVPGGWGWLLLADGGGKKPEGWLLPLGLTLADVVVLHASGLTNALVEHDPAVFARTVESLLNSRLAGVHREYTQFCFDRIRKAAERWQECTDVCFRPKGTGHSLAEGAGLVLERLELLEAAFVAPVPPFQTLSQKTAPTSSWPDGELEEDDLVESLIDAYPKKKWTAAMLRKVLSRGGRRRAKPKKSATRGPALLKRLLEECVNVPNGPALGNGESIDADGLFKVFDVGNGDSWVVDRKGNAMFSDHESPDPYEPPAVALDALIAAWLFNDEVLRRGLEEHPDVEEHAAALCSIHDAAAFPPMD